RALERDRRRRDHRARRVEDRARERRPGLAPGSGNGQRRQGDGQEGAANSLHAPYSLLSLRRCPGGTASGGAQETRVNVGFSWIIYNILALSRRIQSR